VLGGEMKLKVAVWGQTWEGFHSTYTYCVTAKTALEAVEEIDQVAGDFELIERFSLFEINPCPYCGQDTFAPLGVWVWDERVRRHLIEKEGRWRKVGV